MLVPETAIFIVIATSVMSADDLCLWPCREDFYCDVILLECLPCSDICSFHHITVTEDCKSNCPGIYQSLIQTTTRRRVISPPLPSSSPPSINPEVTSTPLLIVPEKKVLIQSEPAPSTPASASPAASPLILWIILLVGILIVTCTVTLCVILYRKRLLCKNSEAKQIQKSKTADTMMEANTMVSHSFYNGTNTDEMNRREPSTVTVICERTPQETQLSAAASERSSYLENVSRCTAESISEITVNAPSNQHKALKRSMSHSIYGKTKRNGKQCSKRRYSTNDIGDAINEENLLPLLSMCSNPEMPQTAANESKSGPHSLTEPEVEEADYVDAPQQELSSKAIGDSVNVDEVFIQGPSESPDLEAEAAAEHKKNTTSLTSGSISSAFSLQISAYSGSPILQRANFNAHESSNIQDSNLGPLINNWHYYSEFDLREDPPPMNAAYNGRWTPPSNVQPVPRSIGHRANSDNNLTDEPQNPLGNGSFTYESNGGTKYKIVSTASMRALADERMHYFHILDRIDYIAYYISGREGIRIVLHPNTKSIEEAKKDIVSRGVKQDLIEVTIMDGGEPEPKQPEQQLDEQHRHVQAEEQGAVCLDLLPKDLETDKEESRICDQGEGGATCGNGHQSQQHADNVKFSSGNTHNEPVAASSISGRDLQGLDDMHRHLSADDDSIEPKSVLMVTDISSLN